MVILVQRKRKIDGNQLPTAPLTNCERIQTAKLKDKILSQELIKSSFFLHFSRADSGINSNQDRQSARFCPFFGKNLLKYTLA